MNGLVSPDDAAISLAHAQRLSALDTHADTYLDAQTPKNTRLTYEYAWKAWVKYTETIDIPIMSNTRGALVGFVVHLEHLGLSPNTISSRLSGAIVYLRNADNEPAKKDRLAARAALDGYKTRLAKAGETRGRGQAPALTVKHLRQIVAACPDSTAGTRDKALVLVAFSIAARRSEVANLDMRDFKRTPEGLIVAIRYGKTGGRSPQVPAIPGSITCPVAAWEAWAALVGEESGGAFRGVHRSDKILKPLSPKGVGDVITRAARRAGLTLHFTGHSARAGMATEARRAGHDKVMIADQGGWRRNSAALEGYFREVDHWTNNPLNGIGL